MGGSVCAASSFHATYSPAARRARARSVHRFRGAPLGRRGGAAAKRRALASGTRGPPDRLDSELGAAGGRHEVGPSRRQRLLAPDRRPVAGAPAPGRWRPGEQLEVMNLTTAPMVRRAGCRGHRGLESRRVVVRKGLRVVSPQDTWCDLAAAGALDLDELIVLGDAVLHYQRGIARAGAHRRHHRLELGAVAVELGLRLAGAEGGGRVRRRSSQNRSAAVAERCGPVSEPPG